MTHTHSHTRINTYTQRWHAGASLDGLLWWNLRAESSVPLGELNSGHRRVTVTGRGNPGQCLAPPPALPLWRPSWLGRSHWWEGHRPLSRSCSVDRERRVNGRAMRFIAFCPNSSSTKAVSKRALLLLLLLLCDKHQLKPWRDLHVTNLQFWTLMYLIHHLGDEYTLYIQVPVIMPTEFTWMW